MIDPGVFSIFSAVAGPLVATLLGVGGIGVGLYVAVWALSKSLTLIKGLLSDQGVREMTWDHGGIAADRMAGYAAIAQGAADAVGQEDLMGGHDESEMDSWTGDGLSDDQRMSQEYADSTGESGSSYDAEADARDNEEHDAAASHYLSQYK